MKLLIRSLAAAVLVAVSAPAASQASPEMAAARQAGTIGERYDGYLGYSAAASEKVRREVGTVNIKRRSLYTGLATRRGATVQEVGIAAGCELLAEVKVGESYMLGDEIWRRRAAGEAPPVPSYCRR